MYENYYVMLFIRRCFLLECNLIIYIRTSSRPSYVLYLLVASAFHVSQNFQKRMNGEKNTIRLTTQ